MSRFFFGVVPPEYLQAPVELFRGRWGHPHHNVEPHVTVKSPFPWTADPAVLLAPVRRACAAQAPFSLRLGMPGRFPDAGVLYLAVEGAALHGLHRSILEALDGLVPRDPRGHEGDGYHPHLTLAVMRFGIDAVGMDAMEREAADAFAGLEPFPVRALRCYRREKAEDRWQRCCDLPLE